MSPTMMKLGGLVAVAAVAGGVYLSRTAPVAPEGPVVTVYASPT
jgi:hypothetical protein